MNINIDTRFWFLGTGANKENYSEEQLQKDKSEFEPLSHFEKLQYWEKKEWTVGQIYPLASYNPFPYTVISSREEITEFQKKWFRIVPSNPNEYDEGLEWFRAYYKKRLNPNIENDFKERVKIFQSQMEPITNAEFKKNKIKKFYERDARKVEELFEFRDLWFKGEREKGLYSPVSMLNNKVPHNMNDEWTLGADLMQKYIDYHSYVKFIKYLNEQLNKMNQGTNAKKKNRNSKKRLERKIIRNNFVYSDLNKYFFTEKIEPFKRIETELINKDFFVNGAWSSKKPKKLVVALIHILYKFGYLKNKLPHKETKRQVLITYRKFIEQRYKILFLSEEFQPSRFDETNLKPYKADFFFIPEVDSL